MSKKILYLCVLLFIIILPASTVEFRHVFDKRYFLEIKTNVTNLHRINGEILGESTNKEVSYITVKSANKRTASLESNIYIFNEEKQFNRPINHFEQKLTYRYTKDRFGNTYGNEMRAGFHGFPGFPKQDIPEGGTWTAPATYIVSLFSNSLPAVKIELNIFYQYIATKDVNGKKIAVITANAVASQSKKSDVLQNANIIKVAGFNNFILEYDIEAKRIVSIKETFDYLYVLGDYSIIETSGTSGSSFKYFKVKQKEKLLKLKENETDNIKFVLKDDNTISISMENITFEANSAVVGESEKTLLDQIAPLLIENYSTNRIIIIGHTAKVGKTTREQRLSEERARAVLNYLLKNYDFDPELLSYKGMGGTQPIDTNTTEEGRQKNRRVEIIILP